MTTIATIDIKAEQRALGAMTLEGLRHRYAEVFGESTNVRHKQHLTKRILWRVQALAEGGLSERARARARELARGADLRLRAPASTPTPAPSAQRVSAPLRVATDQRLPPPGTVLRRTYKGRAVLVKVLPRGFEFEGEVHRSLSAVANAVTGSHVNGMAFFGLRAGKEAV